MEFSAYDVIHFIRTLIRQRDESTGAPSVGLFITTSYELPDTVYVIVETHYNFIYYYYIILPSSLFKKTKTAFTVVNNHLRYLLANGNIFVLLHLPNLTSCKLH